MKVSIVVPTFNRSEMLRETINSILNQTFKDIEVTVIDNCSVDNTKTVLQSFNDKRIRYFEHPNNGIIAVNMNYGMKKARGEYIAFCDDDDLWMPNKLEKQLFEFEKDEKIALICSNGINFNKNGDVGVIYNNVGDKHFTFEALVFENRIINSSILVKKSVIDEVGMMDEEPEFLGSEEYSLWIRIAKKYKIKYINLPLVKYRTHPGVYRRNETESLNAKRQIFKKLLKNKIIDNKLYKMAVNRLDYKYIISKLVNEDDITLGAILKNKMSISGKSISLIFYFLLRIRMFNNLRHIKHKILCDNINSGEM